MTDSAKATALADQPFSPQNGATCRTSSTPGLRQRAKRTAFRGLLAFHAGMLWLARRLPRPAAKSPQAGPSTILLTGTFFSENWIMNHLRPLALSDSCDRALVVSLFPIPNTPKVEWIAPPRWLCRLLGETPARLLIFVLVAVRNRPDWIGGFHLIPNGLVVGLLARLVGARSLYFCGGGPREVLDGGIHGNRALEEIKISDPAAETRLIEAINSIDRVICMGDRTVKFYRDRGVDSRFEIIPGGIDRSQFRSSHDEKLYDLILVGRLVEVKRIDLLLEAVAILGKSLPKLQVAIVGAGGMEAELKQSANRLGVTAQVLFAGHQVDVAWWLRRARIFVLTSESEGLSLAMLEALSCGVPCVVADVGELGEVIENDKNGFLVQERSAAAFTRILQPLLSDPAKLVRLSAGAAASAEGFALERTARKWDAILRNR